MQLNFQNLPWWLVLAIACSPFALPFLVVVYLCAPSQGE